MRLLPLLAFALAACGGKSHPELDDARARWVEQGASAYSYEVGYSCFCPESHARVVFGGGQATVIQEGEADVPEELLGSIEDHFAFVEATLDSDADSVEVEYHETYGFPVRVQADPIEGAADDEWSYTISNFRVDPEQED